MRWCNDDDSMVNVIEASSKYSMEYSMEELSILHMCNILIYLLINMNILYLSNLQNPSKPQAYQSPLRALPPPSAPLLLPAAPQLLAPALSRGGARSPHRRTVGVETTMELDFLQGFLCENGVNWIFRPKKVEGLVGKSVLNPVFPALLPLFVPGSPLKPRSLPLSLACKGLGQPWRPAPYSSIFNLR